MMHTFFFLSFYAIFFLDLNEICRDGITIGDSVYDFECIFAMDLKGLWVLQGNGGSCHNTKVSFIFL